MAENSNELMDKLVALCKRRGFIFQSSEIYGGIGGFWDYGPLGVELKRNVKAAWWEDVVRKNDNIVGLDCSIIMNPKVWEASGHVGGFSDPMVDCKECKARFRTDKVAVVSLAKGDNVLLATAVEADDENEAVAAALAKANSKTRRRIEAAGDDLVKTVAFLDKMGDDGPGECPKCGGALTEPREFNLMFQTYVGALQDSSSVAYLSTPAASSCPSGSRRSERPSATRSTRGTIPSAAASSNRWKSSSSAIPTRPKSGTFTGATPVSSGISTTG